MKKLTTIALLCSTIAASAQNIQPWSGYAVHDENRPHPAKIEVPTHLSLPAPSDAVVIFDGKNSDAFTKKWTVEEGILIATKGGKNSTKQSFSDCQIHLEWRIPKGREVKGQKGGNSGIFMMGLYEIQIQESHTNITYADGQAGAIYGQSPPLVNPSRPQGEWQSYDITFKAPIYKDGKLHTPAYVTVIHNGIVIHNNQLIHGPTKHKVVTSYPAKHPESAPITLQWHSDPIEFKNFWVRDLSKVENAVTQPTQDPK